MGQKTSVIRSRVSDRVGPACRVGLSPRGEPCATWSRQTRPRHSQSACTQGRDKSRLQPGFTPGEPGLETTEQTKLSTRPHPGFTPVDRWFDNSSRYSVKCGEGLRGVFSKECLDLGSVQNCGQIVGKPWHHRREAEGGRVMYLSSLVVSKPGLHRRRGERGPIATGSRRKAASSSYRTWCRMQNSP